MLVKPTVAELLEQGENRYRLVVATAKRARQLSAGKEARIETEDTAPVTIAANEIKNEAIRVFDEEEWKEYVDARKKLIIEPSQTIEEHKEEGTEE